MGGKAEEEDGGHVIRIEKINLKSQEKIEKKYDKRDMTKESKTNGRHTRDPQSITIHSKHEKN